MSWTTTFGRNDDLLSRSNRISFNSDFVHLEKTGLLLKDYFFKVLINANQE